VTVREAFKAAGFPIPDESVGMSIISLPDETFKIGYVKASGWSCSLEDGKWIPEGKFSHVDGLDLSNLQAKDCAELLPFDLESILASTPESESVGRLTTDDVEWVVNSIAELGVKIGNQFFFCYKGSSLVYEEGDHDEEECGGPLMWRPVFKREFGECIHPINHADYSKIGKVSPDDSDEWKLLPLPIAPPTDHPDQTAIRNAKEAVIAAARVSRGQLPPGVPDRNAAELALSNALHELDELEGRV
jgi:hypothetical protein